MGRMGSASNAISAATLLASSMLGEMTDQPEPGHIGGGADAYLQRGPGSPVVQRGHRPHRVRHAGLEQCVPLECGGQDAGAQAAWSAPARSPAHAAGVGQHPVGMHLADHRHAEGRLDRVDRVAAEYRDSSARSATSAAPRRTSPSISKGSSIPGPAHQVEARTTEWPPWRRCRSTRWPPRWRPTRRDRRRSG